MKCKICKFNDTDSTTGICWECCDNREFLLEWSSIIDWFMIYYIIYPKSLEDSPERYDYRTREEYIRYFVKKMTLQENF